MKAKQSKSQRIAELERKLKEALAGQIHTLHFADAYIEKASVDKLLGSGVVITVTALGGKPIVEPTMIANGLSNETIAALRADFRRSFAYSTELKPKEV